MSTIASPRPRATSPAASTRSSLTIDRRRNRTALRDYYNLKANATNPTSTTSGTSSPPPSDDTTASSLTYTSSNPLLRPLTAPNFVAADYVEALLATSSLAELIGAESALVSDVRGLDGERKALVYDNYSKLIVATSTIGRMREEMGPVEEGVKGLQKGLEGIVGVVEEVVTASKVAPKHEDDVNGSRKVEVEDKGLDVKAEGEKTQTPEQTTQTRQARDTVRWVLDTPRRLNETVAAGKQEEAEADWAEVNQLLDKWKDVKGVRELREQSISALHP